MGQEGKEMNKYILAIVLATSLSGCSHIQTDRLPWLVEEELCEPIAPYNSFPPINSQGIVEMNREDREDLLEWIIRVEGCLRKMDVLEE